MGNYDKHVIASIEIRHLAYRFLRDWDIPVWCRREILIEWYGLGLVRMYAFQKGTWTNSTRCMRRR